MRWPSSRTSPAWPRTSRGRPAGTGIAPSGSPQAAPGAIPGRPRRIRARLPPDLHRRRAGPIFSPPCRLPAVCESRQRSAFPRLRDMQDSSGSDLSAVPDWGRRARYGKGRCHETQEIPRRSGLHSHSGRSRHARRGLQFRRCHAGSGQRQAGQGRNRVVFTYSTARSRTGSSRSTARRTSPCRTSATSRC